MLLEFQQDYPLQSGIGFLQKIFDIFNALSHLFVTLLFHGCTLDSGESAVN